jgi:hypothetical protein
MNGNTAMQQQESFTTTTGLRYVNPRDGSRPASIKGTDGQYYTISDVAFEKYQHMQGQQADLTYVERESNGRVFRNLTALNGEAMPRDQRRGAPPAPAPQAPGTTVQQLPVQPAPRPVAPVANARRPEDVPPGICGILKSAIESGVTREEAQKWIALGLGKEPIVDDEIPY